uniref:25S rRNA (uridine-N(3))-methyltransferase BMT5-like domain-containing protein n=1 Tax=Davidia involucrata TaxID=16924 RepID=A0A5B7BFR3_DAVIN
MTGRRRPRRKKKVRWIQHYNSSQKILLVGEGDFSFSACLARAFGSAINMVATSLHSEDTLIMKHWSSVAHLEDLERLGCRVLHEVDVYKMNKYPTLKHKKFDIIIYNFPHAGHYSWLCERDAELIEMHKELLRAFFKSAREMLTKDGSEVHVTHRDDYPYNTWEVEKLAEREGLHLKQKAEFRKEDYPGYHNKRGGDINSNKTFPLNQCFTFKFTLEESTSQKE